MASKNGSKLYRSETNKVIAGVCGGLGEYFDIDPVILRIILVLITIFGGSGLIIYFVLWIVVPSKSKVNKESEDYIKENVEEIKTRSHDFARNGNGRIFMGIILVILGASFLLENLGIFIFRDVWKFWPIVLIALGLTVLSGKSRRSK
jgi:phage shock protein PspC (stress-responsive transcriptional regulator)